MKFIDEVTIEVFAGKGGKGSSHFRREKYVPFGGPDGGNGGAGGSVILIADRNKHTLLDFKFHAKWEAQSGAPGEGSCKDGRSGEDLQIHLPIGTQVLRMPSKELVVDLDHDQKVFTLCKGGRGGKGNNFFKTSTNQAPTHAQPGEEGESGEFLLSLKLVADVGLIGFPNAGKSTLISRISAARPKIADYPFTTLTPNLGVVDVHGHSFVVADVPGLIPGAHQGKGLGIKFLKHIERTRVLAHLIDPNQLDENGEPLKPKIAFELINRELKSFSAELGQRPQIVVITKAETVGREALEDTKREFESAGYQTVIISSVTGEGIDQLKTTFFQALRENGA